MLNPQTLALATTGIVLILISTASPVYGNAVSPLEHAKHLVIDGQEFDIFLDTDVVKYDVSFAKEEKKLHIDIEGTNKTDQSRFFINIPDPLLGGNYTVLVDGKQVNFKESRFFNPGDTLATSRVERQLWFNHSSDAKSIDIVGTTVVPEFGSVAIVIGAVSISSVILAHKYVKRRS